MPKTITTLTHDVTVAEQIYWIEVLKGVWITHLHFVRNMWGHILHAFGIRTKNPPAETFQYPEVRRPIDRRWRGRHRLTVKQNGAMRCTACMLCETICPCDCIHITPGESPDPHVEKFPERFDIDILRCCFCGLCAEACPVDAIRMDVHEFDLAGYTRDIIYTKEFLLGQTKQRPWEKWLPESDEPKQLKDAA
ncbi:MAG: NADH-quinone oxidoreductase subunit I [Calditrichaeota bacterium]|nr:NADH-quinone oxidoreductase subunit I [Calditrichota bacterium]